jgi:outer membrane protein OmpA-like peptidoglycan-associated protein
MTKKYLGQYQDAAILFKEYIGDGDNPEIVERAKLELAGIEIAKKAQPDQKVVVELAAGNINKKTREMAPRMSGIDEIYFSSLNRNGKVVMDDEEDDPFVKILKSTRADGKWSKGEKLDEKVNREGYNNLNPFVTRDGKRMYFNRVLTDLLTYEEVTEAQVYVSYMGEEGWGPARKVRGLGTEAQILHPVIGELFGREVMFFSANMEGGYGGMDIYYASKKDDEEFTNPVNLGSTVNSDGDDVTPFYVDGRMYFSTNGKPGLGGMDVFVSDWNGSEWSNPKNLGREINSPFDDWYFSIDENGTYGTMTSNRTGVNSMRGPNCCDDIWTVFIDNIQVDVDVRVVHEGTPTEADIELIKLIGDEPGTTESAKASAQNWPLEKEVGYMIIASAEGYVADTVEFNTVGIRESTTLTHTLNLKTLPPPEPEPEPEYETYTTEEPIRLNNIYYDYDDDKILPDAEQDLSLILELMNEYGDMVIELSSHTDARGEDDYNVDLSQRRANSAKSWLLEKGVLEERINPVGYGEKVILNQCTNGVTCTDDEHRYNRRTEFKIISGPTSIKIKKQRLKKNTVKKK